MMRSDLEETKKMIQTYLRRVAVLAKIGIEDEGWTREEAEKFVMDYGNEQFGKILGMSKGEFATFVMRDTIQTIGEHIMKMEEMK